MYHELRKRGTRACLIRGMKTGKPAASGQGLGQEWLQLQRHVRALCERRRQRLVAAGFVDQLDEPDFRETGAFVGDELARDLRGPPLDQRVGDALADLRATGDSREMVLALAL